MSTPEAAPVGGETTAPGNGTADSSELKSFGYEQQLNRVLTLKDLIIYGLLFMVIVAPIGIFGEVHVASGGMVPFVYLVGLVAMLFTALSYAAMAKKFPIAGSVYSYVQRGINPHVGFAAGWLILIDYILIPALLYSFCGVWMEDLTGTPGWIWIILLVVVNGAITFRGIKFTAVVDWIFFAIEIATVIIFLVVGFNYVLGNNYVSAPDFNFIDPLFNSEAITPAFIATAASIACLSFLGFDGISTLAEETKNPEKTVGKATFLSLLFIGLIFISFTWMAEVIWGGRPLDGSVVTASGAVATEEAFVSEGFFLSAETAGGAWLRLLTYIVIIIASGIPNAVAAQSAITRVLFSMSRDGLMPKFMSIVHPRFATPHWTILFIGVVTLGAAFIGPSRLVRLVNFGGLTSFIVLNFAVFWYFFIKEKMRHTLGEVLRYCVCPMIGVAILGFVWSGFDSTTLIVGFSWLAIGIVVGAIKSKGYKEVPAAFKGMDI